MTFLPYWSQRNMQHHLFKIRLQQKCPWAMVLAKSGGFSIRLYQGSPITCSYQFGDWSEHFWCPAVCLTRDYSTLPSSPLHNVIDFPQNFHNKRKYMYLHAKYGISIQFSPVITHTYIYSHTHTHTNTHTHAENTGILTWHNNLIREARTHKIHIIWSPLDGNRFI